MKLFAYYSLGATGSVTKLFRYEPIFLLGFSGHKTRSVFDRYDIVIDRDIEVHNRYAPGK
jgi:hypothetical protein